VLIVMLALAAANDRKRIENQMGETSFNPT
jgi:hypothetical protein